MGSHVQHSRAEAKEIAHLSGARSKSSLDGVQLARPALQHLDGLLQLLILLRAFRLADFLLGRRFLILIRRPGIVIRISNLHIGSNGIVLNRLASRGVVLGDRQNQRRTVRHFDGFLNRAVPEGLVTYYVATRRLVTFFDGSALNASRGYF